MISTLQSRDFLTAIVAQIAGSFVAMLATAAITDWHTAGAVGYGGLMMAGSGFWLALRLKGLGDADGKATGATIAGSRFIAILALLAAGYTIGLWLPAIALGILAAQTALYGSGLYLLTRKDAEGGKV
ncbi:MAG: hypothetical protein R8J84_05425 [Mariprofundales bacterium]